MEAVNLDGMRIVVVEDDFLLASEICRDLRDCGATVLGPAPTPFYAMQLIGGNNRRKLNAAILDINLHGTKVYELADALQDRGVPFLFATAYGRNAIPGRFDDAPLLEKPIDRTQLLKEIAALIRSPAPRTFTRPIIEIPRELHAPEVHFAKALARSWRPAQ